MKFVLIGAGQRGMIYAQYAQKKGHEIAAVAETDPVRRGIAAGEFGIPDERCFSSGEALLLINTHSLVHVINDYSIP